MSKQSRGIFEKMPGSGQWWIRYADCTGRIRREKAGTWVSARDLYIKRKAGVLQGRKLPERLRQRPISFRELADDAIAYIKQEYARPADDVARAKIVKEWFGERAAESITREEVKSALNSATNEKEWSLSTRHHYQNVLSLIYRLAIEHDPPKVERSPVTGIRRKKENNDRVRFLTHDEEKRLRQTLRSKPEWAEHLPEVDLAMNTGLRRTNMYIDLVWENVDLSARIAMIPTTKNDDPVYVPLNEDAMRALGVFRSRGDGPGRVVRNAAGKTLNVNAHWFVDAVRQAKIPNFRWHDLRHTYASRLRQNGVPLGNIAELLGHKGLKMTRRYAHLAMSNLHVRCREFKIKLTPLLTPAPRSSLRTRTKFPKIIRGGERGPVTFPAFKAGDAVLRGPSGGFDFHTLPPLFMNVYGGLLWVSLVGVRATPPPTGQRVVAFGCRESVVRPSIGPSGNPHIDINDKPTTCRKRIRIGINSSSSSLRRKARIYSAHHFRC
jgi:integrase